MAGFRPESDDANDTRAAAQASPPLEESLRSALRERLGESSFALWFGEGVRLRVSGNGDVLEVLVPDPFLKDWIQNHYSSSLLDASQAVTGKPLRVVIQTHDESEISAKGAIDPGSSSNERTAEAGRANEQRTPLSESPDTPPPVPSASPGALGSTMASSSSGAAQSEPDRPAPLTTITRPARANIYPTIESARRRARRLDNFVTGPGNRLAHAAAREMAETGGSTFNPLVIHSAVGLGKTHLLEGISHALKHIHPSLQVVQLSGESFTNGFLESMRANSMGGFRTRLRTAGALIVDDVHFLADKRATMIEFLYTFNTLFDRGAPIVLSAHQHPRAISRMTDELVTRFLAGMVVKIEPPDLVTRQQILELRAAARGVKVPDAVINYIAEHLRSNVRELEGALHSVIAHTSLAGGRIDLNFAKSALRDLIRQPAATVALRDVERAVCQLFQISADALKSDRRTRALAYPRMLAMYLARQHTTAAYTEIGRHFGGRDHSTVIAAEKKVQGWLRAAEQSAFLPGFESVADVLAELERTLGVHSRPADE